MNFAPYFVAPEGKATVKVVADHVEHIAKVAGKKQSVFREISCGYYANISFAQCRFGK